MFGSPSVDTPILVNAKKCAAFHGKKGGRIQVHDVEEREIPIAARMSMRVRMCLAVPLDFGRGKDKVRRAKHEIDGDFFRSSLFALRTLNFFLIKMPKSGGTPI
jgi:hypothetical protein